MDELLWAIKNKMPLSFPYRYTFECNGQMLCISNVITEFVVLKIFTDCGDLCVKFVRGSFLRYPLADPNLFKDLEKAINVGKLESMAY